MSGDQTKHGYIELTDNRKYCLDCGTVTDDARDGVPAQTDDGFSSTILLTISDNFDNGTWKSGVILDSVVDR